MDRVQTSAGFQQNHVSFMQSTRKHVLMVCTQGVHQWKIIPGLPDTGGQNVFVNQLSDAMVEQGYRVTIANRGGYLHPTTQKRQEGLHYKDAFQRLVYLEDGLEEFVRKEDLDERVGLLAGKLADFLQDEGTRADLVISHYWDGARVGDLFNQSLPQSLPHVWVPHSLGKIKKENVTHDQWEPLRIDERIEIESTLLSNLQVVAATSSMIRESLIRDYRYAGQIPFLPPCVDPKRYHPEDIDENDGIWSFLAGISSIDVAKLKDAKIVTEISRTDTTKRKDVLIQAFAQALKAVPNACLIVSIDQRRELIAEALQDLITKLEIEDNVIVVGSIWEQLPKIYAITDIYCTPSVMEGFGMSAQEAAATGVPVVASNLVPFVREYLLGREAVEIPCENCQKPLIQGEGAIEVQADDVNGFSRALVMLLQDDVLRERMGQRALEITIPYFTWSSRTRTFLHEIDFLDEI